MEDVFDLDEQARLALDVAQHAALANGDNHCGTEYLLSGVFSEGSKRGMSLNHMVELVSWNPAQRYGLLSKGDIAVGYDADLVLLDPNESFVVRADESFSGQGHTPFEGQELTGRVKSNFLRGDLIYHQGEMAGSPQGKYLKRPYGLTES